MNLASSLFINILIDCTLPSLWLVLVGETERGEREEKDQLRQRVIQFFNEKYSKFNNNIIWMRLE